MIRWLAAALLLFAAPVAFAQAPTSDAMMEQLIRGSYASFIGADVVPRPHMPLSNRLRAVERECAALQKKIDAKEGPDSSMGACSDDYGLLCQCQDMWGTNWMLITVAIAHPDPARTEAIVTFPPVEGSADAGTPDIKWVFARAGKGWVVDDFWEYAQAEEGEGSYRKRMLASIADMRGRLKLPAWREPAR